MSRKTYLIFAGGTALFLVLSLVLQSFFFSAKQDLNVRSFQAALHKKTEATNTQLNNFNGSFEHKNTEKGISYYIYRNDTLVFWTSNELSVPVLHSLLPKTTSVLELPNAISVFQERQLTADSILIAVIKIKNTYALPNQYLRNDFTNGFDMPSQVEIEHGKASDAYAVMSAKGDYLFSLSTTEGFENHRSLGLLVVFSWAIFFVLLFITLHFAYVLWGEAKPRLWFFPLAMLVYGTVVFLGAWVNEPVSIFWQELFSPIFYASGSAFSSLAYLLFFSITLFAEIVFFFLQAGISHKKKQLVLWKNTLLQAVFLIYFCYLCSLFHNLIFNSTFDITLTYLENISWLSVTSLLIVLSWFVGFVLLRNKILFSFFEPAKFRESVFGNLLVSVVGVVVFLLTDSDISIPVCFFLLCLIDDLAHLKHKNFRWGNISVLLLFFSLFIVFFSLKNNQKKMSEKYRMLAENTAQGELADRNFFAEILLEDLNHELLNDDRFCEMLSTRGKTSVDVSAYLHEHYFGGYWKNYDVKIFIYDPQKPTESGTERINFYEDLQQKAEQIRNTNFYFYADEQSKTDYLGIFNFDEKSFYIIFSPKRYFSGYSYPEPLFRAEERNSLNASVSVANYENDSLRSRSGSYRFPSNSEWLPAGKNYPLSFNHAGYTHFVNKISKQKTIVISQKQIGGWNVSFTYYIYLFTFYFLVIAFFYLIVKLIFKKQEPKPSSFLSRLHASFQVALVISFAVIFAVSADYLISQYKTEQTKHLQDRTRYIRQHLREMFHQYDNVREINTLELGDYLHNLSNIYQTDIHIYDSHGRMVASSQPILFSRGLVSSYIAPEVFFDYRRGGHVQTEHIGELSYLSAYTRIFNEKHELLGFVAVPSFLSSDEMQKEIFNLLALLINIYLMVLALASFATWLIERKLKKPIKALEEKLKTISLTGHNEHLDYRRNDEIGQLVVQYNQMADKLQKSVEKLAQSERETAWKQMARQVTHEINNPLTPMKLSIQQLQRMQEAGDERFNEYFKSSSQMLIEQIENLSRIATAFSAFAKMPDAKREPVDICARLESVTNLFKNNGENAMIHNHPCAENLFVLADKEQLTQLFNNLIKNAIQSIPTDRKGQIDIKTTTQDNRVCIEIRDNGSGISPKTQAKMFVPNFTTKSSGMGMGLAIVKNIVENNSGTIRFQTVVGEGTSFFVEFPLI